MYKYNVTANISNKLQEKEYRQKYLVTRIENTNAKKRKTKYYYSRGRGKKIVNVHLHVQRRYG
jgi:hypothetical protein